ncbi:MAG: Catabolite control protein A [Candidatus Aerophobetes bacterium ADurb.Bin490]|nr:MAG: Catabolite control protein A [Candidatus Aerophobetes bacterium ADurb.Bin490]HPI03595.1 substrate-binding domain-containing protein [Candidatus Goldiibacteriota bacterium]HPN63687.1 substrate-binding domain-containing protein [Candidatus Goldiibacteriota bacterium]HRQ44499.1 substrate-binding domain-containing protein [Candidatus Goldiibacteriota bacterium]
MNGTKNIAVVVPSLRNMYTVQMLWAVQARAYDSGYDLLVYTAKAADKKGGMDYIYGKIAEEKKAGAAIIMSFNLGEGHKEQLLKSGIAPVVIEGESTNTYRVVSDSEKGGYEAGKYLAQCGYNKIGFISGLLKEAQSQRLRFEGFTRGLKEKGIEFPEHMKWEAEEYNYKAGKDAFRYMFMNDAKAVFVAAGDYVAQGFINEARKNGITVPECMAVVGFDDVEASGDQELTTIRQPIDEMGKLAFDMAVKGINEPWSQPYEKIMKVELVVRKTA